jgi:hypothetical protein
VVRDPGWRLFLQCGAFSLSVEFVGHKRVCCACIKITMMRCREVFMIEVPLAVQMTWVEGEVSPFLVGFDWTARPSRAPLTALRARYARAHATLL